MRRLNVKLFLYVVGSLVLLSGALFTVHRLQAGSISEGLLWQARQAEKEGRLLPAARYFSRYLDFVPKDLDARAQLGKVLADSRVAVTPRARNRARFVLEQVLTLDPNRHDVRRCLVRLALDTRDFELAKEHLEFLQKLQPNDGDIAGLFGEYQELKGESEKALASHREAVRMAPDSVDNRVRLASLLRRQDGGQRGELFKEAESNLAAALAIAPDDTSVLLAAAELSGDKGDLEEARARLDHALKLKPREARVHLALARLDLRANKRADALACLKRGLQSVAREDRYELNWMLANVHIDAGELDEAKKVIARIQESSPGPGATNYLQGRCLMQQGRWFEASRLLERVRSVARGIPALAVQVDLNLGVCYEHLEDPAQQLAACRRAAEQDPSSLQARQGIAAAHWALGQTDAAIASYREIVKLNEQLKNTATGRVELARLLLLRTLRADQRDWRAVAEALDEAAKEQPDSVEVPLLRADMLAAQKKPDEAEAVLKSAVDRKPKQIEFWTALASLADRQGDPAKAHRLLDDAEKQAGDSVELRLARARALVKEPKDKAAEALHRLEEGLDTFPADKQAALLDGLGEIHYRANHVVEATRLWRQLTALPSHARDLRLRQLLFDLALTREDDVAMRQALDEIKTLEGGESALWLFGEATRHLALARRGGGDRKALDTARTLLDRVVAQREAWPSVLLAKAEMEEMAGNVEQAITQYRRALERGVLSPKVVRNLVQLLTSRQRYEEAEQELHKLQQKGQTSPDLQRIAVDIARHKGDLVKVERMVGEAVSVDSKDFRDHLWRGQMLAASGRSSEPAEKALRRAVELAGSVPETWVALVNYLARSGQKPKALEEIDKAAAKLTGFKGALALAQCYEAVEQADKARAQYQAALQTAPNEVAVRRAFVGFCLRTGAPQQAVAHLREIYSRKLPATDAEVTWARRALALTVASTADHKHFAEALTLVGLSLDGKGNVVEGPAPAEDWPVEEFVVRARVLATQPRHPLRAKAVALLEGLHKRGSLPPNEQLLLAELYEGMGADEKWWGMARELLHSLATTHVHNPLYLGARAQALLRHGELVKAEPVIANLERVEKERQAAPGAHGSIELKAQVLERRGRAKDAAALLKRYAELPNAPPERLLLRAGLEGRLGHVKEALDLCEEARAKCSPEAVGGASVALLREGRPRSGKAEDTWREQAARAEAWLQEAIEKDEAKIILRLQLADLLALLNRPDKLEKVEEQYEKVRQKAPSNLVALNNLSWLLAQQKDRRKKALELVQLAIEAHGPRPELLDTRGFIYLELGQTVDAIRDLEQAVVDAPSPVKFFHLSRAHHAARDQQATLRALSHANEIGLTPDRLPPAERAAYDRLMAELKQ